jgi:hypothetical protein
MNEAEINAIEANIKDKGYAMVTSPKTFHKGIQCLNCGLISYNTNDILNLYCANCNIFHEDESYKRQFIRVIRAQ